MTHTELAWFLGLLVACVIWQLDRLSARIDRLRHEVRDPRREEDEDLSEYAEDD